jgi:hypothetical protein
VPFNNAELSESGYQVREVQPFHGVHRVYVSSSVSIVSGYGLEDRVIEVPSPAETK